MSLNEKMVKQYALPDLIRKKRNGHDLTAEEIDYFIKSIGDYGDSTLAKSQMGALIMAIYFRGMSSDEVYSLTRSMIRSGTSLFWENFTNQVVDYHCAGGVGDKVGIILAPVLASCGLKVPMISGRGLGFDEGTLDKLECIPGLQVAFSKLDIELLIDNIGCCFAEQTHEFNPAERTLYATSEITSTSECLPLIAASIISKKAIEDLDALVVDLKIGKCAFIQSQEDAEIVSEYMLEICKRYGLKVGIFLTENESPLGRCVGNQLEIEEIIDCLLGEMTPDLDELVTKYGGYLLQRCKLVSTMKQGQSVVREKLKSGEALFKFKEILQAQGVSNKLVEDLCNKNYDAVFLKKAKYLSTIKSKDSGYIKSIDAWIIGQIAIRLGAIRTTMTHQAVSSEVGFRLLKKPGEQIEMNEPWLEVFHNNGDFDNNYAQHLINCIDIVSHPIKMDSAVLKIIDYD